MNVREQVDWDYARARRRALIGRLLSWLRKRCVALCAFDDVRRERGAENRRYLGRRTVELCRIVGSVGRWREFDGGFMPTRASEGRWKRVDLAFRTGRDLPPVVLYKLGDELLRRRRQPPRQRGAFRGVEMIDAEVTEFFPGPSRDAAVAG